MIPAYNTAQMADPYNIVDGRSLVSETYIHTAHDPCLQDRTDG